METALHEMKTKDFIAQAAEAVNAPNQDAVNQVSRHLYDVLDGRLASVAPSTGDYQIWAKRRRVYGRIAGGDVFEILTGWDD